MINAWYIRDDYVVINISLHDSWVKGDGKSTDVLVSGTAYRLPNDRIFIGHHEALLTALEMAENRVRLLKETLPPERGYAAMAGAPEIVEVMKYMGGLLKVRVESGAVMDIQRELFQPTRELAAEARLTVIGHEIQRLNRRVRDLQDRRTQLSTLVGQSMFDTIFGGDLFSFMKKDADATQ